MFGAWKIAELLCVVSSHHFRNLEKDTVNLLSPYCVLIVPLCDPT